MEGKFFHGGKIKLIKKDFPIYLETYMEGKDSSKCKAKIVHISEPHITGTGDNEQIVFENEIKITGINESIPLTYIENIADAKLTIKVGSKPVATIEKMQTSNDGIAAAIARGVNDYIKSFN
jgi:hypothetical protein